MKIHIYVTILILFIFTVSVEAASFPVRVNLNDKVGKKSYMESSVTVSKHGRIDGETKVKTCDLIGFIGAVRLVFYDRQENILHTTKKRRYGIDGHPAVRCNVKRTKWHEKVPANIINKINKAVLQHAHIATGNDLKDLKKNKGC